MSKVDTVKPSVIFRIIDFCKVCETEKYSGLHVQDMKSFIAKRVISILVNLRYLRFIKAVEI